MKRQTILRIIIGAAISLLFIALALREVDWPAFALAMRRAAILPLLAAAGLALLGVFLRAIRWHVMVTPIKRVRIWRLFEVLLIGSMANNVLPARLGELVRAFLLGRSESVSKSAALATIVYERLVDVFATLALLWIALYCTPAPPWLHSGGVWMLALNSVCMGLLLAMVVFRRWVASVCERLARPLGHRVARRIRGLCDSFVSGLEVSRSLPKTVQIVLLSIAVMLASIMAVYVCLPGMSIHRGGFDASVTLTVLVSFAIMIPAAPGNVGPVQYACIVGLALYGVDRSSALAYSLVYHATQHLPVTLAGLVLLWREQMGLIELASSSDRGTGAGASEV